jgi:hypothetical protein
LVRFLFCLIPILLVSNSFGQASSQAAADLKKPLIYQIGQNVHINAAGARPLLQAVDALQQKYGWTVSYEDPQYPPAIGRPVTPAPGPVRRHPNTSNSGPAGFTVQFNVPADSPPDERIILGLLVEANNQSNDAGQFELRKENDGGFAIVGVGVRDQNGETSIQRPVLDSLISFEAQPRSATETIALICEKTSQQNKIQVTLNVATSNLPQGKTVALGASGVSARTLLSRTLASIGGGFYWRLLYDSNGTRYELTISRASQ